MSLIRDEKGMAASACGWRRLLAREHGMAATEYALLAAALVVCLYAASTGLRAVQSQAYQHQQKALLDWRSP